MLVTSHKHAAEELGLSHPGKAWKYIFVDVEKFPDHTDKDKLEWAIEVVQLMNFTACYNKLKSQLGLDEQIDFSIGGEAISAIVTETPFTDNQLRRFFTWEKELEFVYKAMAKFLPDEYYLPYQVEYLILGLPFEEVLQKEHCEKLSQLYGELSIGYLTKDNIPLEQFIEKAKRLIRSITKSK